MSDQRPDQASILTAAHEGIYDIRRQLEALKPALAAGASEAIDAARQDLCGALVRRLEIAESEVQELLKMLDLDGKK